MEGQSMLTERLSESTSKQRWKMSIIRGFDLRLCQLIRRVRFGTRRSRLATHGSKASNRTTIGTIRRTASTGWPILAIMSCLGGAWLWMKKRSRGISSSKRPWPSSRTPVCTGGTAITRGRALMCLRTSTRKDLIVSATFYSQCCRTSWGKLSVWLICTSRLKRTLTKITHMRCTTKLLGLQESWPYLIL